jgi:hypothetical protein
MLAAWYTSCSASPFALNEVMLTASAPRLDRRTLTLGAITAVLPRAEEVLLAQFARAPLAETMVAEIAVTLTPTHS